MKFNVSNTNAPIWRDVTVHAELPAKLKNLDELSRNVWWSWNSEAKRLFHDIDADLWRATGENPVMLLHRVNLDRYNELANDKAYLARLDAVYKEFKEYMSGNLVGCRMHLTGDVHFSVLERIGARQSAEGISILRSEKNWSRQQASPVYFFIYRELQ